jgi:hypothetical protein
MQAEEGAEAPEGGGAEKHDEGDACKASGCGSFAPRLEHSKDSNDKDQNRGNGQGFQPHKAPDFSNSRIEIRDSPGASGRVKPSPVKDETGRERAL